MIAIPLIVASLCIAPDDCVKEYLIAVNGNAMSWFCQRWDLSNRDFEAKSSMELYRTVAGDVLAGNVYDIRAYGGRTILIKGTRDEISRGIQEILRLKYERAFSERHVTERLKHLGSRLGMQEYEWVTSHTEQGLIRAMVEKFGDVRPGKYQGNPNSDRIPIKEGPDC